MWSCPLRKKCPYLELFWSVFPTFGLNTEKCPVSLRIQSECGKIRTRKTTNRDTFHAGLQQKFVLVIVFCPIFSRCLFAKGDVKLEGMKAKCRGFFCSCTCVKVLFTDAFLKCWFRWKVETILTFPAWNRRCVFM